MVTAMVMAGMAAIIVAAPRYGATITASAAAGN
jgi:hypothetical protein